MKIKGKIQPRITIPVCAPQRVQPPAIPAESAIHGAGTVYADAQRRRGLVAAVQGSGLVTALGNARRGPLAPVAGSGVVVAEAGIISHQYDDIAAMDPAFFVQFVRNTYNGKYVLFQDAACTVPVTLAGSHTIGGAKNPFTGAIIFTQSSAGRRLLWTGSGARFDGVDDYLQGVAPFMGAGDISQFVSMDSPGSGQFMCLMDGGAQPFGLFYDQNPVYGLIVQKGAGGGTGGPSDAFAPGAAVWGGKMVSGAPVLVNPVGAYVTNSRPIISPATGDLRLGIRVGGTRPYEGILRWAVGVNRSTTLVEESKLRALA